MVATHRSPFFVYTTAIDPDPDAALACCAECGTAHLALARCGSCRPCPTCHDPARYCTCGRDDIDWCALTDAQNTALEDAALAEERDTIAGELADAGIPHTKALLLAGEYLTGPHSPFADAPYPDMGDPYP